MYCIRLHHGRVYGTRLLQCCCCLLQVTVLATNKVNVVRMWSLLIRTSTGRSATLGFCSSTAECTSVLPSWAGELGEVYVQTCSERHDRGRVGHPALHYQAQPICQNGIVLFTHHHPCNTCAQM